MVDRAPPRWPFRPRPVNLARSAWSAPPEAAGALAAGGPFALVEERCRGRDLTVFQDRPMSLRALLERSARLEPELPFLTDADHDLSYADVVASVARIAGRLREWGAEPGDRIAFAAANSMTYVVAWWAVTALGGVAVGLNGWWTSDEVGHAVRLCEPRLVLADPPRLEKLPAWASRGAHLLADLDGLVGPARLDDPPLPDHPIDEDDPAAILFTSGTTGRAKGAVITHRAFLHRPMATALRAATSTGLRPSGPVDAARRSTSLLVTPLFHVSGVLPVVIAAAFTGRVVLPPPGRWDELSHLRLTQAYGVTTWTCVPTQLWRLFEHPDFASFDTSSVTSVGGGGSVFAPELLRLVAARLPGARVSCGYGATETTGAGTILDGVLVETAPTSVGVPEPLTEVEIKGADGRVVAEGVVGEIALRGPSLFAGYWNDPAATAAAIDADGWYLTGDYGFIQEGTVFLESRIRDLIIRGGENVYPIEIENRLVEHEAIDDAAVIGLPHRTLGQEPAAVVAVRAGSAVSESDVQRWVGQTLAPFKVPVAVFFREQLPRNASGKVLKHVLEAELAAADTAGRHPNRPPEKEQP